MRIKFHILLFLTIFLFSCQSTEQKLQSLRKEQHKKCGDNRYKGKTLGSEIITINRYCDEISGEIFNLKNKLEREGKENPECPICSQTYSCQLFK